MPKIYLVRHGQDCDNAKGILNGRRNKPLTRLGEVQAQRLAESTEKTAKIKFDRVFSSPLDRANKTARIITDYLGLPKPVVLVELIERDFGEMTGQPVCSIMEKCSPNIIKAEKIVYFLKVKGAEIFPVLLARAKSLVDHLKADYQGKCVLLVSHGDIGKMIYAAYYGLDWQEILTMFYFGNSDMLIMSETSPAEEPFAILAGK